MFGLGAEIVGLWLAAATVDPAIAREPDEVAAVAPAGPGILTKCRDWLITSSCKTYHHIDLPPRIAVGETITVTFGSSPKEYAFPVARITHKGRHCVIFSEAGGDRHHMDKINVSSCYRAGKGG